MIKIARDIATIMCGGKAVKSRTEKRQMFHTLKKIVRGMATMLYGGKAELGYDAVRWKRSKSKNGKKKDVLHFHDNNQEYDNDESLKDNDDNDSKVSDVSKNNGYGKDVVGKNSKHKHKKIVCIWHINEDNKEYGNNEWWKHNDYNDGYGNNVPKNMDMARMLHGGQQVKIMI
ncbi:unnamed protein product [Mytilus coruscus]|uniref:Uncharacterized protein n=1 Tax=Mytilus coruscus TaxID=42192 RepID=A0A6J8C2F2_MYTCO|nr:unnamed protein product [Mytilus coruscus]